MEMEAQYSPDRTRLTLLTVRCTVTPHSAVVAQSTTTVPTRRLTFRTAISQNLALATAGSGVHNGNGGTVRIVNTVIADNAHQELTGSFVSLGHNLLTNIAGSSGFTLGTNNPNGDLVGANSARVFPLLGPLQNNGGSTQTRALLPGSPAIDAGDNCVVLASGSGGCLTKPLTTDQRGVSRQANLTVDIGAFESRGFTMSATSGTPQSRPVNRMFAPLVVTVNSASGDPVAGGLVFFRAPTNGPTAIVSSAATKQPRRIH